MVPREPVGEEIALDDPQPRRHGATSQPPARQCGDGRDIEQRRLDVRMLAQHGQQERARAAPEVQHSALARDVRGRGEHPRRPYGDRLDALGETGPGNDYEVIRVFMAAVQGQAYPPSRPTAERLITVIMASPGYQQTKGRGTQDVAVQGVTELFNIVYGNSPRADETSWQARSGSRA